MGKFLEHINSPQDIRKLSVEQLEQLAIEIREFIIDKVSKTGGHLASNLGVVELTLAMHYVFDFDTDHLLWDVGHQCYTHKIITGRKNDFDKLRKRGGVSGFPAPEESDYDRFEVGHAGTSIATALGIGLAAKKLNKEDKIVALVGDASIVNGLSLEALNNLQGLNRQLLVVLNDNSMAIDVTQGAIAKMFSKIRLSHTYEEIARTTRNAIEHLPLIGKQVDNAIEKFKKTVRMGLPASRLFESLNLAYFGPVDGHDIGSLIELFEAVKELKHPAVLHVYTKKGKGFTPAHEDPCKYHSTGPFQVSGMITKPLKKSDRKSYTQAFGESIVEVGKEDDRVVTITAAMPDGTGLSKFRDEFPDRYYDVGIAESAAVDIAAGQAKMGLKPVVCIYSTFLQRSFDQIAHEVSLQNLPVIFCIDRAGVVGDDGPTHHGMMDICYTRTLPNMTVLAPATEREVKLCLDFARTHDKATAIRYPRDFVPDQSEKIACCDAPFELGKSVTVVDNNADVVLVSYGAVLANAVEAAETLEGEGVKVDVINARFAKPLDNRIFEMVKNGKTIITIEDHNKSCGFGSAVVERLHELADIDNGLEDYSAGEVIVLGGGDEYIQKASRDVQMDEMGISSDKVVETVKRALRRKHSKS